MGTSPIVRVASWIFLAAAGCEEPALAPDSSRPEPIRHVPSPVAPAEEGASSDFLQQCVVREPILAEEAEHWEMPFQARRVAIGLMIIIAQDRVDDLDLVLTPDAMWGLPETRRFGARPIFDHDGPGEFVHALREAGHRFPPNPKWRTLPLTMGTQETVRSGAEPLWSFYENGVDRIYFRIVLRDGRARIDYVGLFEGGPPDGPISTVGQGRPLALGPLPRRAPQADATVDPSAAPDVDANDVDAPDVDAPGVDAPGVDANDVDGE